MKHKASAVSIIVALVIACLAPVAQADDVTLFAPEDGGTPRDPNRIVTVGPGEFRIRACAEEGRSPLTHAVSRVDLVCRNGGAKSEVVKLHIDLSDDGRRTNADNNSFGGMSTRDFLFIQAPGQAWKQINGHVSGWVCTAQFSAPPGETKIGLSPWYTYADYLAFIRSLPEHPHLKKTRLGTSDGGREHWEMIVTDPCVPLESKRTIFWHAREHAYETFSSYAMEGLVAYLLSEGAADARRRYRFVLHPMTNVDGVAQGCEYRGGYDLPQPRGTATAKLTFDAMDRLRPHFAVTWHNWVAPRDVDCLFYTDSEEGRASRRAWDLFTQRFPSPRGVGHRWESETNPLAKNWFGRTLRESNVHEYAMKRYGTQVWGWEMPWWGRNVDDARKAGADFARVWLAALQQIDATRPKAGAGAVFPGRVWAEASPESQGVDAAKLKEAVAWLDQHSGHDGAKELVVIRNGYLIWKGPSADACHAIFSCTKVFTSTVLGLLADDGECRTDDCAIRHLPGLDDQHPAYAQITLRHLASMSGGYRGVVRDVGPEQPWGDPMGYLLPQSPRYESGTACAYHDHDVFLLGQILTCVAREPLQAVFRRRIAEPIGMTRWDWGVVGALGDGVALNNAAGTPARNPGIQTTALDLARLGHLYLNRGNWNGTQLLSAEFVDQATTNQVPASRRHASGGDPGGRYGFYWWLNTPQRNDRRAWPAAPPQTYAARGASANACFIVPEWNMVIVRLATTPEDSRTPDSMWDTFFGHLAAAVSNPTEISRFAAERQIGKSPADASLIKAPRWETHEKE